MFNLTKNKLHFIYCLKNSASGAKKYTHTLLSLVLMSVCTSVCPIKRLAACATLAPRSTCLQSIFNQKRQESECCHMYICIYHKSRLELFHHSLSTAKVRVKHLRDSFRE